MMKATVSVLFAAMLVVSSLASAQTGTTSESKEAAPSGDPTIMKKAQTTSSKPRATMAERKRMRDERRAMAKAKREKMMASDSSMKPSGAMPSAKPSSSDSAVKSDNALKPLPKSP